jgi:hypothetical protein
MLVVGGSVMIRQTLTWIIKAAGPRPLERSFPQIYVLR